MFTAALFTIVRLWKQPKCPSTDEWIKKMWYIYTMEYYSAIKRNKIGSFVEMQMDLETVIQNEVRKRKTNIVYQHIYVESRKMVQMSLFCRAGIEMLTQRTGGWTRSREGEGGMNWEVRIDIYTLICIKWITNKNLLYKK